MHEFTDQHQYPFPAAELLRKLTDPGFLQLKYAALGRRQVELVDHKTHGHECEIQMRYLEPTESDRLPDIARKFMSSETLVEQTVRWNLETRVGSIALRPHGPAKMDCRMRFEDNDAGSCLHLQWEVRVSVPLVGGKLEQVMAEGMRVKSRRDEEVTTHILQGGD